jgi:hypothetical protein
MERERNIASHLSAILVSVGPPETGAVSVWVYRSSKEAQVASERFEKQYSSRLRHVYRRMRRANVFTTVIVMDGTGGRDLREAKAAMADLVRG